MIGLQNRGGVAGDGDRYIASDILERLGDGMQIAHSVIDDGDFVHSDNLMLVRRRPLTTRPSWTE